VLRFRHNARVFRQISSGKTPWSPSLNCVLPIALLDIA
jgi:hypothetical protein